MLGAAGGAWGTTGCATSRAQAQLPDEEGEQQALQAAEAEHEADVIEQQVGHGAEAGHGHIEDNGHAPGEGEELEGGETAFKELAGEQADDPDQVQQCHVRAAGVQDDRVAGDAGAQEDGEQQQKADGESDEGGSYRGVLFRRGSCGF